MLKKELRSKKTKSAVALLKKLSGFKSLNKFTNY